MATVANVLVLLVVGVGQCYGDRYIDLGYEVNEDSMYWPSGQPYTRKTQHKGYTDDGYWWVLLLWVRCGPPWRAAPISLVK